MIGSTSGVRRTKFCEMDEVGDGLYLFQQLHVIFRLVIACSCDCCLRTAFSFFLANADKTKPYS